jgi:hypothetical protein
MNDIYICVCVYIYRYIYISIYIYIYINECSEIFPLNSGWTADTFFGWGDLPKTVPSQGCYIGLPGNECVTLPYQTALGDSALCVWVQASLVGWSSWSKQVLRSGLASSWQISSCQPLPLTGQACELEMSFSLCETVSFSLLTVSPRQCSAWLSPQGCWAAPHPHELFQLCIPHPTPGRGEIFLPFGHKFCSEECNQLPSCTRIWGSLPNSVLCSLGGLADSLCWEWTSYRAAQAGSRDFVSAGVWQVLVFPDACSNSLSVVLCVALLLARLQTY